MIEADSHIRVRRAIDRVWTSVGDMRNWASLMPGYRDFEMFDADRSLWILKVGAGALIRTVKVRVNVVEWRVPESVRFDFKLDGDPVHGDGSYTAMAVAQHETDMVLKLSVIGEGPMAPVWEAMSRPLLPSMLAAFAEKLKADIESSSPDEGAEVPVPTPKSFWERLLTRLRGWFA